MSAFAYGRITRQRESIQRDELVAADAGAGQADNKLITAIAGIVPVEIIAAHGLILAATTKTDAAGNTTITSAPALQLSLLVLLVASIALFLFGRGLSAWKPLDNVRLVIPPLAFLVWTALIGTSALSPWVTGVDHAYITVVAAGAGVLLVAISGAVAPPKSS